MKSKEEMPSEGKIETAPGKTVSFKLRQEKTAENAVDFFRDGELFQSERELGDHFENMEVQGKPVFFHLVDLNKDGRKELIVRLTYLPIGVVRVLQWNEASGRFEKMKFGEKHEDGVPVPIGVPITFSARGDILYMVKEKKKKKARRFMISWVGPNGYRLPAKEL